MSLMGQTETLGCVHDWSVHACQTNGGMSAWCQNPTSSPASFDHLVGASEKVSWHHEVERFRGLEVERKLDNCGPLDRDIGGLCTPQQLDQLRHNNLAHQCRDARTIGDEATLVGPFRHAVDCGQPDLGDMLDDRWLTKMSGPWKTLRA